MRPFKTAEIETPKANSGREGTESLSRAVMIPDTNDRGSETRARLMHAALANARPDHVHALPFGRRSTVSSRFEPALSGSVFL